MTNTIFCPKCSTEIEVSTALATQLSERIRREHDAELRRREIEFTQKEQGLRDRERALETSRQAIDDELNDRLAAERLRLLEEARSKAQAAMGLEIQDLEEQLTESRRKLGDAQKAELQLRRERQELEDQKGELELTLNRRMDEERKRIRDEAKQELAEEVRLRDADKDKHIADLRSQIDDLKRVAEQGSPQARGEVMELVLEDLLRDTFVQDTVEPVPVSYHGGDVLQHVHDGTGLPCGTILWESKRTKNWNECWLPKLRDDQRAAKAHIAVLVTAEMPKGIVTFNCIDGVWVTNRLCLLGLASALRIGMIEAARSKRSAEGRQTKAELLYNYLASTEFRQRIEGIVEAFITMRDDLDSEKRSMQRIWAKREKQLDRAVTNTAGLYGDLGGILGSNLPQITHLELASLTSCCEDAEPDKAPWE